MKLEDLKSLSAKIVEHAQKQKIEAYYHQFSNLLQQRLRGNREVPFTDYKDYLLSSLRSFDQMSMTYSEKNLFQILSYDSFVGSKAVAEIEGILHDEAIDPGAVLQNIENKFNAYKHFIEKNRLFQSALRHVPAVQETFLREGEALLEITFADETAVANIVDFEEWIGCWTKIIRAFGELIGEKPENARIVFVQKTSPMMIDVATASVLVFTLGKAMVKVLDIAEKYLRIRTQADQIRKLKLENKRIERDLMDEAKAFSLKSTHEIALMLAASVKPRPSPELLNDIGLAVKSLFLFADKGGRVDCPSVTNDREVDGITEIYNDVRKLQQSLDQLRLFSSSCDKTDSAANT